jgi:hypothetical protein
MAEYIDREAEKGETMADHFEFRIDEEQKPLTKEEAIALENALLRWAFADEIKAMQEANNG